MEIKAKVVSQRIWLNREIKEIEIKDDVCGYYYFVPTDLEGFKEIVNNTHRRHFEEIEIIKVGDNLYHLNFYSISNQHIRSENPFLVLEMTGEEIENWKRNDIWFEKEYHYIVRTEGKKIYGPEGDRRCIKCHYLVGNDATECERCK